MDLESGFEGTGQEKTVRKKMSINSADGGVSLNWRQVRSYSRAIRDVIFEASGKMDQLLTRRRKFATWCSIWATVS